MAVKIQHTARSMDARTARRFAGLLVVLSGGEVEMVIEARREELAGKSAEQIERIRAVRHARTVELKRAA